MVVTVDGILGNIKLPIKVSYLRVAFYSNCQHFNETDCTYFAGTEKSLEYNVIEAEITLTRNGIYIIGFPIGIIFKKFFFGLNCSVEKCLNVFFSILNVVTVLL